MRSQLDCKLKVEAGSLQLIHPTYPTNRKAPSKRYGRSLTVAHLLQAGGVQSPEVRHHSGEPVPRPLRLVGPGPQVEDIPGQPAQGGCALCRHSPPAHRRPIQHCGPQRGGVAGRASGAGVRRSGQEQPGRTPVGVGMYINPRWVGGGVHSSLGGGGALTPSQEVVRSRRCRAVSQTLIFSSWRL